jgi:hypothetical protein
MTLAIGKNGAGPLKALPMMMAMVVGLVLTGGLHAADQPIAPAPAIDNGRVLVWRLQLKKGETGPYTPKDLDTVVMFLKGGRIRSEGPDGHHRLDTRNPGDAIWVRRGSPVRDTPVSAGPVEEVVVALKDAPVEPLVNSSGLPTAFPRPGSRKILENSRVIVWQYSWVPGRPSPMHFHDKDVVVAYREEGSLQSVSPTGERTVNAHHPGEIRFNTRNRSHSEQLLSGRQSAVMVELK